VRFGNSASNSFDVGDTIIQNADDAFIEFTLENSSGADVTVKVSVGFGDVRIAGNVTILGTPAVITYGGDTITAASVSLTASTLIKAANTARTDLTIVNTSAVDTLYIGPTPATVAGSIPILPGQMYNTDNRAAFYGISSGGAIDVRVLEGTKA
jgi:hypothetical protein